MTKKLHISPELSLPLSFVTTTQAILGKKRGGKSYKASVQCEELLDAGQQVVVLDPTSAWWGLRSSVDGKHDGYPITIFGGEHGDLPLEATAGEDIADAIIGDGFSAILDLDLFTKGEEQRFCAAFLERLYRKKRAGSGSPLHLFLDEADVYAPQRPFGPDEAKLLGACQSIVRRGGIKGIGCTMITQRPAVLNKDVLSQVDMLTVLRMNHPKDLKPIDEWVSVHGDPETAKEMIAALPSLPKGDAFVWAPVDDIFKRITFRDRKTFDSGATPKPGERRREPKRLAPIDLERLGERIRASAERAKENDPRQLKAKIAELIRERDQLSRTLNAAPTKNSKTAEPTAIKKIEVPIIKEAHLKRIEALERKSDVTTRKAIEAAAAVASACTALRDAIAKVTSLQAKQRWEESKLPSTNREIAAFNPTNGVYTKALDSEISKGERKILSALVQYPEGLQLQQITVLTGYKATSRYEYLRQLKVRGLVVEDGDRHRATDQGIAALPDVEPLPHGRALQEWWLTRLSQGEKRILEILIAEYPKNVDNRIIEEATNYKSTSRYEYLRQLAARQLAVVGRGGARASDTLFD